MPTDPAVLQDALTRTAETHGPGLVTEHDLLTADMPVVAVALGGGCG